MVKTLIVGRGWVGNKLHKVIGGDICSHNDVFDMLGDYDWIINCAGVTGVPNVDYVDPYEAMMGNTNFPILLGLACANYGKKLMHFSSGCVYKGEVKDPEAMPNYMASAYSQSKAASDIALRGHAMIMRIRMPFDGSHDKKNLLTKLESYATNGKLVDLGQNSLSDVDEMVDIAANMIGGEYGCYNLVNSGSVSNREIAEMMGLKAEWFKDGEFTNPRSSCVITPNVDVKPVVYALEIAIGEMYK